MKKVFTHENRMIVYNMRNLLQGEGIETVMKNEFSGGGVGDLPAFDTWPEVWVCDEAQAELALIHPRRRNSCDSQRRLVLYWLSGDQ